MQERDLHIERICRSGPGGQHRNRKATGIRLTHLPTGIVCMATTERSQALNLEHAKERLSQKLAQKLQKNKKRIPTKLSKAKKQRRLQSKRRQSEKKALRQKPSDS